MYIHRYICLLSTIKRQMYYNIHICIDLNIIWHVYIIYRDIFVFQKYTEKKVTLI